MKTAFNDIFTSPENQIFKIVFYPDRIYHQASLSATISCRYRYNVAEVRSKHDITVLTGGVYLDGEYLCNFMRIEYRGSRLSETVRSKSRILADHVRVWVEVCLEDPSKKAAGEVRLTYDHLTDSYAVEIWQTLEPLDGMCHDYKVLALMGADGAITCLHNFYDLLSDVRVINMVELAFTEDDYDMPFGYRINANDKVWDNDYMRTYQAPNNPAPNSPENTVEVDNYALFFQKGWFLHADQVPPVRYENAMMDGDNPERKAGNIVEMQWILQRELGGNIVYFHQVTVTPGSYEGAHRHIGSEELYFITEGKGIAYMGEGDDPSIDAEYETVTIQIYGVGPRRVKQVPVEPGSIIYTKSGGIHGIRNPYDQPLRFVAFGYHSS